MLYKRLEHDPSKPWFGDLLQQVIFVYNYMDMSPSEARQAKNETNVRLSLNKRAKKGRMYPEIKNM